MVDRYEPDYDYDKEHDQGYNIMGRSALGRYVEYDDYAKLEADNQKLREALVHQVGDHRECPKCRHVFIPSDATQREGVNALIVKQQDTASTGGE